MKRQTNTNKIITYCIKVQGNINVQVRTGFDCTRLHQRNKIRSGVPVFIVNRKQVKQDQLGWVTDGEFYFFTFLSHLNQTEGRS